MRRLLLAAGAAAALAVLAGCPKQSGPTTTRPSTPPPPKVELVVGVAASMSDAFDDGARAFAELLPRVKLAPTVAATGVLVEQARAGAPIDLLLLADPRRSAQLVADGLVDLDDVRPIAGNALVAVVPAESALYLRDLGELVSAHAPRIAIGAPATVPAGAHAQRVLNEGGIWDAVSPRIVPVESVRHALDLAVRGDVDLAFVYRTDAQAAGEAVRVVLTFPIEGMVYDAILLKRAKAGANPASAKALFEFFCGERFRDILQERGFRTP